MAILKKDCTQLTKEKLSIGLFGKRKFYLGLTVGLFLTILIYLLFAYFRELLRRDTLDSDLIIPTKEEFYIYNLFFAAVSVTIGFGVTVWFWFHGLFSKLTPRWRINYISAFAMFWGMTLLYVVSKLGTIIHWVLFAIGGYDNHLNLSKEFPLLLFLLPTVLFLNIWTPIRLSYRSGTWLFKSIGLSIVLTIVLAFSSPIDQTILNKTWEKYMTPYNEIVDSEIRRANSKGIEFSKRAIETIRFNKKKRVIEQVTELKNRFKSDRPIPTDSVVLELILVKKTTVRFSEIRDWDNKANLWPFALPRHIYKQLTISNDSVKNDYLREILIEYDSIFNDDRDNWERTNEDGLSDRDHYRFTIRRVYKEINSELIYYNKKLKERY